MFKNLTKFHRGILNIATGGMVSQSMIVIAMPFLTRLYTPEQFGAMALFSSAYAVCLVFSTMKYDLAIIEPEDSQKAETLFFISLFSALIFSCIFFIGFSLAFLYSTWIEWYFILLAPGVIFGATITGVMQIEARVADFSRYSRSQIIGAVVNLATCFFLAFITNKISGSLVLGIFVGTGFAMLYLIFPYVTNQKISMKSHFSSYKAVAYEYKRFPLLVLPTTLMIVLGSNITPFILAAMFSQDEVGYYAIANRLLLSPTALLGLAIAESFRAEYVNRRKKKLINSNIFLNLFVRLLLFSIPTFLLIILFSPMLFHEILGSEYLKSGYYARILSFGIFAQFIAQPFLCIFVLERKLKTGLFLQIFSMFLPSLGIIFGGLNRSLETALIYYSVLSLVCFLIMIEISYRTCKLVDKSI